MTERLVDLPTVSRLSPRIVRILGGNPGKFTLQGTNTYLISSPVSSASSSATTSSCILVDTGEGHEGYIPTLRSVLEGKDKEAGSNRCTISDIILTHRHHDHVGGLSSVLRLLSSTQKEPPRLHKFPDPETDEVICKQLGALTSDVFPVDESTSPLRPLKDGDEIRAAAEEGLSSSSSQSGGEKGTATLTIVHSPGHTKDHICLYVQEERALLTGDHVLGQGTSVFEDLGAYLQSLQKCSKLLEERSPPSAGEGKGDECRLYPAHGPTIEEGKKALAGYLSHRLERENQILDLLAKPASPPADGEMGSSSVGGGNTTTGGSGGAAAGGWTIKSIVSTLYSNYPEHLYPAAARGIFLHLQKLASPDTEAIERGVADADSHQGRRVECIGSGAGPDGTAPAMPNGDAEWFKVMELQWRLIASSASQATRANSSGAAERGSL